MMLKYQTSLLSQFHYNNYNGLLTFTLPSIIASAMIASNVICNMFSFSLPQLRMLKNLLKSTEDECIHVSYKQGEITNFGANSLKYKTSNTLIFHQGRVVCSLYFEDHGVALAVELFEFYVELQKK